MIGFRIKVTGRVQGVFFRASTKQKANELGVNGWVRNESDGSVLIEAEGNETKMKAFKRWCAIGPPASRVDGITVEEIPSGQYSSFEITH